MRGSVDLAFRREWRDLAPRVIWALLFAYVSLVPFYYLQPARLSLDAATITIWKYLPLLLVGILSLIAVASAPRRLAAAIRTMPRALLVGIAAYGAISLASVASGVAYRDVGLFKSIYYAATGLLLPVLLYHQLARPQAMQGMIRWMVLVAAMVAIYGVVVNLSGSDLVWGEIEEAYNPSYSGVTRAGSTLGNPVVAGCYLALCLPFALWARKAARSAWSARSYGICSFALILSLVLSFSRGAWLAAATGCGVLLWPSRSRAVTAVRGVWRCPGKVVRWAFPVVVLMAAILLAGNGRDALGRNWDQLLIRARQTVELSDTDSHRLAQFRTTWRVLQARPLLGLGFGSFSRLFDKYKDPSTPPSYIITTDNMYLMVTCETGLLGLATFIAMLWLLGLVLHRAWSRQVSQTDRSLQRAALAAFAGFLVNMTGWDSLNHPSVRITFWMLMGLSLVAARWTVGVKADCESATPSNTPEPAK